MREEWEAQRAIEANERNELAMAVKSYEDGLNNPIWLGYMIKSDKAGYIRAMSKARNTFRGMDPRDPFCGMRGEGNEINPDFVAVVEDFYLEIRRDIKKYDYQLAKYNFLRDALIERFEGDEKFESIAREDYNISKEEYFEKIKKGELIYTFSKIKQYWVAVPYERYVVGVQKGLATENYPIAS